MIMGNLNINMKCNSRVFRQLNYPNIDFDSDGLTNLEVGFYAISGIPSAKVAGIISMMLGLIAFNTLNIVYSGMGDEYGKNIRNTNK